MLTLKTDDRNPLKPELNLGFQRNILNVFCYHFLASLLKKMLDWTPTIYRPNDAHNNNMMRFPLYYTNHRRLHPQIAIPTNQYVWLTPQVSFSRAATSAKPHLGCHGAVTTPSRAGCHAHRVSSTGKAPYGHGDYTPLDTPSHLPTSYP